MTIVYILLLSLVYLVLLAIWTYIIIEGKTIGIIQTKKAVNGIEVLNMSI